MGAGAAGTARARDPRSRDLSELHREPDGEVHPAPGQIGRCLRVQGFRAVIAAAHNTLGSFHAPHIDWKAMSPLIAVLGGSVVVLLAGLLPGRRVHRVVVPALAIASLLAAIGLTIWIWEPGGKR